MKLMILIDCDHEDFFDHEHNFDPERRVAEILKRVAQRIEDGEALEAIAATPLLGSRKSPAARLVIGSRD